MAVPAKMSDLATLAASNSPQGSDAIGNSLDDFLRALSAIVRSTNALSSATIAAASTTDLGTSDAESVIITGSATITSFGTTASGIKREVIFTSAGSVLTNSAAIVLPTAANITVLAGEVYQFRSLGSGNWRMVGPRTQLSTTDIAGLTTALALYLPLAGGALTGQLTTNVANNSLLVNQGATASMATATSGLGGLQVQGASGANAAFASFVRQGNFGAYFGIDSDNAWKVGGFSMGANAYRVVHEGLSAVSLPGSLGVGTTLNVNGVLSGQSLISSSGASAGFKFADRSNNSVTAVWYATSNTVNLFTDLSGTNVISVNESTGATSVTGVWTGPNFIGTSDERLKYDIQPRVIRERLADLLEICDWLWKANSSPGIGPIAQRVREIAPEYVHETEDGVLGIDKAGLALECVAGLSARVRALEGAQ